MASSFLTEPHLYWKTCWDTKKSPWHQGQVHDKLVKYEDKLLQDKSKVRVFIPLCGKSLDIKWFYDKGHTVVGVELVEKAVEDFFLEHSLDFHISTCPQTGSKIYQVEDGRLQIFVTDMFTLTPEALGMFEAVWDRGALVAISPGDRSRYASFMRSLLTDNARVLIESVEYQKEGFTGPPTNVPIQEVQKIYNDLCSVEVLATNDISEEKIPKEELKLDWCLTHYLLLRLINRA